MNKDTDLKPRDRAALQSFIQKIQTAYRDRVQEVILFGSKARGDDLPDSDIDVLVLLRDDDWQLRRAMRILGARVSLEHDVLLSIRAMPPNKWAELARYQFPLYRAIQADGLVLFPINYENPPPPPAPPHPRSTPSAAASGASPRD